MGIKDEDMAGLSDEEIAALEDDDGESEILKNIAGDVADDDGEADDSAFGDDDGDASGDAGKADAADADSADGGDSDAGETVADDGEFRPEFKAERPEGMADRMAELDQQTKDLLAKFKEGEIELPDFMAQKEAIDEQKLNLKMAEEQAKWSEKQNFEIEQQFNARITKQFFDRPAAKLYQDEIMYSVLDRTVASLRAKEPAKGYEWALNEADRQVRQRFKIDGDSGQDKAKPKAREPDLSKVPKTLANLPAADIAETGSDEFAYLDKLDGIALEQALRKLTPEQEARYLGAAA